MKVQQVRRGTITAQVRTPECLQPVRSGGRPWLNGRDLLRPRPTSTQSILRVRRGRVRKREVGGPKGWGPKGWGQEAESVGGGPEGIKRVGAQIRLSSGTLRRVRNVLSRCLDHALLSGFCFTEPVQSYSCICIGHCRRETFTSLCTGCDRKRQRWKTLSRRQMNDRAPQCLRFVSVHVWLRQISNFVLNRFVSS